MTDIHNAAFTLFGVPIYWYGIIIASGVVLALIVAWSREQRLGLPKETTLNLTLLMLPIGVVCARLYYVAFDWDNYKGDLISILFIRQGGMAIYGGIIGGLVTAIVYASVKKLSFWRLADLLAPALVLAQGIGRWGNFMNQEAYGNLVTDPRWQLFPVSVFIDATGSWHLATFFYESAWCLIVFLVLMILERKGGIKRAGDGFLLYLMMYAAERAVVEGLRIDSLMWGDTRVSQMLSALVVAAIVLLFALRFSRAKAREWSAGAACWIATSALCLIGSLFLSGTPRILLGSALLLFLGIAFYSLLPNGHPYDPEQQESQV